MPSTLNLALAQLRPLKGDYPGNLGQLRDVFAQLGGMEPRPHVVHFAESIMSGYFVEGGVQEVAVTAGTLARDLDEAFVAASGRRPLDVVVGFYEQWRSTLYNSAAYIRLGEGDPRVLHVHRKAFLPTYGLFDEERFVERGHEVRAFDTPWGRAALLVCEDAWHSIAGTIAALGDAQVIFISAAAPARGIQPVEGSAPAPASVTRWERLVTEMADEHGVFVSLSNLVGSEGGKIFAGGSCVVGPRGDVRARARLFDEQIVTLTIDLADMGRARADLPLLADLRTALPHLQQSLRAAELGASSDTGGVVAFDPAEDRAAGLPRDRKAEVRGDSREGASATGGNGGRGGPPHIKDALEKADPPNHSNAPRTIPVQHIDHCAQGGPPPLEIVPDLVERWLVRFIRDEMGRRGFQKAIVGISGGVDSAVTAFLAARALGPENVLGLRLPYTASSAESLAHAQLVIDALAIPSRTIDISAAVDGYLAQEPDANATRRGNVMARTRMIALFDRSAAEHGVPLGTGNKSERLFGYFTWHADDSPPINPLGDLFKTQVWALARHLGVPDVIVSKPATADLVHGQTDEGDFGISYARADVILNWLVSGFSARELVARGFDQGEVTLVRDRLEGTHWKRKLPTVAMLTHTAIGESYLRPVDY